MAHHHLTTSALVAALLLAPASGALLETASPVGARAHLDAQAADLGLVLPAAPVLGADPAAALLGVFDRLGVAPSPAAVAYAESLRHAPQAAQVAHVVNAYLALDAATRDVLGAAAAAGVPAPAPQDYAPALAARNALLDAATGLAEATGGATVSGGFDPTDPVQVDLACANNTYTRDYALVIDLCGDDTYRNNAGGTFQVDGTLGNCDFGIDLGVVHVGAVASAAVVDAAGNDVYDASDPADPDATNCGVNGGGVLGAGFLYDHAGRDTYVAGGIGVNGGAHFGVGLLVDAAGDDAYTAHDQGANGGGYVSGHGALLDLAGDDRYDAGTSTRAVNGGAFLGGVGLLVDVGTDETFLDGEAFTCLATPQVCHQTPGLFDDGYGTRIDA